MSLTKKEIVDIKGYVERWGAIRVSKALGVGRLALANAMHQYPSTHPSTIIAIRARLEKLEDLK